MGKKVKEPWANSLQRSEPYKKIVTVFFQTNPPPAEPLDETIVKAYP